MYQTLNSNLTLTLRQYQREDVDFLKTLPCAACFNEPRTGKTPTAITTFVEKGITKFLVVCPNSALFQWQDEVKRWSNLPAVVVTKSLTEKQKTIDTWETGALIISYDSLKQTKKRQGLLDLVLLKNPEGVILDEAHRIKNPKSENAKAAFYLTKYIPNRLALTGTPAPNKPQEVWSILHFLKPNSFTSYWNFINEFFFTRTVHLAGHSFKDVGNIKPSKVQEIQAILGNVATQRKRKDIMPWLPEKDIQFVLLEPTKEQQRYLHELSRFFETNDVVTVGVLDRLTRYRQICLHPGLLNLPGKSPKLDWIKEYLSDYPERPTIIFSKFTSFLHLLSEEIQNTPHTLIVGATSAAARYKAVSAFQKGDIKLILINLDAGKEALTLDTAEAIIFADKYPPVGDIEQAEDRFVATTQAKADKLHIIYNLIIAGTYDEAIYDLIEKRAEAIEVINNFKAYTEDNCTSSVL